MADHTPGQKLFAALIAGGTGTSVDHQLDHIPEGPGGPQWEELARHLVLYLDRCVKAKKKGIPPPRLVVSIEQTAENELFILDTAPPPRVEPETNDDDDWDDEIPQE